MSPMLIAAIVTITLALIFYSIGVIGEARRKYLIVRDTYWFAAGLLFDGIGTFLMSRMSAAGDTYLSPTASVLMSISGTAAIALMGLHLVIAVILIKKDTYREKFHVVSLLIWSLWLVAYALGPIGLMMG